MAEAKHTPGPWEVFDQDGVIGVTPHTDGEADVAHCSDLDSSRHNDEVLANARLIAAAPDLVAVVKRIEELMDFGGSEYAQFDGLQGQMVAAIAKAEGR